MPSERLILLAAIFFSLSASAAPQPVDLLVVDYTNLFDLRAIGEELVRQGAPLTVSVMPGGRIFRLMESAKPYCGLLLPRELYGDGVQWIAPVANYSLELVSVQNINKPPDLADFVAVVANSLSSKILDDMGAKKFTALSDDSIYMAIKHGRVFYWIDVDLIIDEFERQHHLRLNVQRVFEGHSSWLGCTSAVGSAEIERIRAAWGAAYRAGTLKSLYRRLGIEKAFPPLDGSQTQLR